MGQTQRVFGSEDRKREGPYLKYIAKVVIWDRSILLIDSDLYPVERNSSGTIPTPCLETQLHQSKCTSPWSASLKITGGAT